MKKYLQKAAIIVFAGIILCACGSNSNSEKTTATAIASVEETQKGSEKGSEKESEKESANTSETETAIPETPHHIFMDAEDNLARAKQNTYLVNCKVGEISDEYFKCANLRIYLPAENLAKLNKGEMVGIIGKITDVEKVSLASGEALATVILGEAEIYNGEIPEVAPRDEEIFTGTVVDSFVDGQGVPGLDVEVDGNKAPVHFQKGEDIKSYSKGDTITFVSDIALWSQSTGEQRRYNEFYNAVVYDGSAQ